MADRPTRYAGRGPLSLGFALALTSAACSDAAWRFDLSGLDAGPKLVLVLDEQRNLQRTFGPLATGPGPLLDLELDAGEESILLGLPEEVLSSAHGEVLEPSLTVVSGAPAAPTAAGAELLLLEPLPERSTFHRADAEGHLERLDTADVDLLRARLVLLRRVDTEPCPPPVTDLRLRSEAGPFDGLATGIKPHVRGVSVLEDDVRMVLESGYLVRSVGGAPPASAADVLSVAATDPGHYFTKMLRLGPDDWLVVGGKYEVGRVWHARVTRSGLEWVGSSTVASAGWYLVAITEADDRLIVADRQGGVFSTSKETPLGPWATIRESDASLSEGGDVYEDVRLPRGAAPAGAVVVGIESQLLVLEGLSNWAPLTTLVAPKGRRTGLESMFWDARGRLWLGTEGGDLLYVENGEPHWMERARPPRLAGCATLAQAVESVFLEQEVQGIVEANGHILVAFNRCDALWSLRSEDLCPGLVLESGREPGRSHSPPNDLALENDTLCLGTTEGLLLEAELK